MNHKCKKTKQKTNRSCTKSGSCRAARNCISTGRACDHGPAVTHPLTPLLWPLGLRSEPAVNLVLQFSEFSWNFESPFTPTALVCVSCCHPCNSWTNSESFTRPQREGQHCRYTTFIRYKSRERHAQANRTGLLGEVRTVVSQPEGSCSWPGAFGMEFLGNKVHVSMSKWRVMALWWTGDLSRVCSCLSPSNVWMRSSTADDPGAQ